MGCLLVVFEGQAQGFPVKPDSGFVAVRLGENLKQKLGRNFFGTERHYGWYPVKKEHIVYSFFERTFGYFTSNWFCSRPFTIFPFGVKFHHSVFN